MEDDRYRQHVDSAAQRGLADCEAGRMFRHAPLVRRNDRMMLDMFKAVVWTTSARDAFEGMFGKVFGGSPRNSILEQVLDKAAYVLTNELRSVATGSHIRDLTLLWGQARLMYLIRSADVVVVAIGPTLERWRRENSNWSARRTRRAITR